LGDFGVEVETVSGGGFDCLHPNVGKPAMKHLNLSNMFLLLVDLEIDTLILLFWFVECVRK